MDKIQQHLCLRADDGMTVRKKTPIETMVSINGVDFFPDDFCSIEFLKTRLRRH